MLKQDVTLYFVRHGETDWNKAQRYQGQRDIPLNATGRAQAEDNGRRLGVALGAQAHAFDFVSSPLLRTRETMEIVREAMGLPREPIGAIPGSQKSTTAIGRVSSGASCRSLIRKGSRRGRRISGAGSPAAARATQCFRIACNWLQSVDQTAVVVAHGGVMRVLRGLVEGLAPEAIQALPVPQDKVLILKGDSADWL